MAINHEDKLFKLCDQSSPTPIRRFTRRCYNATLGRRTCLCSTMETADAPLRIYGKDSAPRLEYRYPCADLVKYKANYARDQSGGLVMKP